MKTTRRNSAMMMVAAVVMAVAGSGCSVLDAIDRQLVELGVVNTLDGAGIDTLAVVQVVSDSQAGVGVVLEGGMVFTAAHVVAGQDTVVIKTNGYYHDAWYQVLTAKVVYRNPSTDQALLRIEDAVEMKHTVELGDSKRGNAKVVPMRAVGRTSSGDVVKRAVVRTLEVRGSRSIAKSERITYGDSGCPIVQNGKVVGLVMGEGRMITTDVMANYEASRTPRRTAMESGSEPSTVKTPVPECCAKSNAAARS